jgi:arsenate reductase-like glutaredoxin family protein
VTRLVKREGENNMPKIDTTKIENYANMTAEEKLAALEAFEYEADNPDAERLKAAVSKANSEAAELKRQLKARMTEDEQKEAERAAKEAEKDALLESLKKDKAVSESKAKFLGLGYDEKLAAETAKALADGDMEKVFANQGIHLENVKKAAAASALAGDPKPPAGGGGATEITKEQFNEMGYAERLKVFNEQPELFKQFTEV